MSANFSNVKITIGHYLQSIGYALFTIGVVYGISNIIIGVLLGALAPNISETTLKEPAWTLGLYASQFLIGLPLLTIMPRAIQKFSWQRIRELVGLTRGPKWLDLGRALATFVVYFAISLVVQTIITHLIPAFNADQVQNVGFNNIVQPVGIVLAFIALVVIAPLGEELIFRGYIFGSMRPLVGYIAASIMTSAFFGFVHGQWNVGIDVFVLSLGLCYLREKTGAIWAGIMLHATKNFLAFFILFVAPHISWLQKFFN